MPIAVINVPYAIADTYIPSLQRSGMTRATMPIATMNTARTKRRPNMSEVRPPTTPPKMLAMPRIEKIWVADASSKPMSSCSAATK